MKTPFEKIYAQLQYATPVKSRQLLRELERSAEDLLNFCRQARRLPPSKAATLCPILSAMNSPEYMELLRDYALRSEPSLRKAALSAFSRANPSARRGVLLTLLTSSEESVRREVCNMLGAEGEEAAAKLLVKLLKDPSPDVVLAALAGIENSGLNAAYGDCCDLLSHKEPKVRAAAISVLCALEGRIPELLTVKLLSSDPDLTVRQEMCRALAKRPFATALEVLLKILSDENEDLALRISTGRTLEHYSDITAARGLLYVCAHDLADASLVQVCRNSLLRMNEDIQEKLCREAFNSEDVSLRLAGATLAGMVGFTAIQSLLVHQLKTETDPLVTAGLLEEAGRCGAAEAWDIAMQMLDADPLISYAAAQAIARLLTPSKLPDFVNLLKRDQELIITEVILERLASYGKARKLPESAAEIIQPLLHHEYSNIAVLAAEAASRIEHGKLLPEMLMAMHNNSREEVKRALCDGILGAIDRRLSQLIAINPVKSMCEISGVLSRVIEIPDNDPDGVLLIANASLEKIPCANCCLVVCGALMPQSFTQAMDKANPEQLIPILRAWRFLPRVIRRSVTPPWRKLLSSADAKARLLCLEAMNGLDAVPLIGSIADLAFLDPNDAVVRRSRTLLKQALEVEQ